MKKIDILYTFFIILLFFCHRSYAESNKDIFQAVDQSISGVNITGTFTTIYPKESYNNLANIRRNTAYVRQQKLNTRLNKIVNNENIDEEFPLSSIDVIHKRDFEIIYINGITQVTLENIPDTAGGSQYFTNKVLYGVTEDISVTIPKSSENIVHPVYQPHALITKKSQPTNLFFSISAHKFGRGLSSFSGANIVMSKDDNQDNIYMVEINGGNITPDFQYGNIYIDKNVGYCWTEGYLFNQDGLYIEIKSSDFQNINGYWFPFNTEYIYYLPENEWTDEHKFLRRELYEIISIETDQSHDLDSSNLLTPELKIYRR